MDMQNPETSETVPDVTAFEAGASTEGKSVSRLLRGVRM